MTKIKLIIILIISSSILSCSDDDSINQDPIIGNWKIESIRIINLGENSLYGPTLTECKRLSRITFTSNQNFSFTDVVADGINLECFDRVQSISNGAWSFDSNIGYQLSGFATTEVFVLGSYELFGIDLSEKYDEIALSNDNNLLTLQKENRSDSIDGFGSMHYILIEEYSRE